jgi:sugar phosphate permease
MTARSLSPLGRALLAAVALAMFALMATARSLAPDPRGFGTHEQLGLARCWFTATTGWPCPTCGMTTAWAHGTRGDVTAACSANLGGALLLPIAGLAAVWALVSAAVGNMLGSWTPRLFLWMGTAWLAIAVLDWARRLAEATGQAA